jgi:hypothetical protein
MSDREKVGLIAALTGANLISELSVDQLDFLRATLKILLVACHCDVSTAAWVWAYVFG